MRRRILVVALTAVVLAVGLFGIPLAVAVQRAIIANEQGELERLALRAAVSVSPGYTRGDPIELPATEAGVDLAVYDTSGARVTGSGRAQLEVALETSLRGRLVDAESGNDLLVAVPVTSGERLIAVVRAASPESAVQTRIRWTWAAMAGIALVAASVAGAFAAAQSRRLSRPLTGLERAAAELGDGNFAVRTRRSGVPEIDRAGEALDRTAERLADLVARERAFSAHASHQLRTPLTRLRLELETGLQAGDKALRDAAEEAIRSADQLSRTIDDVLQGSRGTPDQRRGFEVEDLLDDLRQRWHGVFAANDRPLRLVEGDAPAS
ncbi:MAG: HAMP domain-containing histidine kinase, partial [Propionibacteriales bacterium]|nr:HAMP domain-containing histidine kinase [Propionibacteriales bacterium]